MGIPIAHRRPHVPGQRVAHAAPSPKAGRVAEGAFSRPASHLRNAGTAKRCGRQDRQQYARALLRGLYAGHLRPCHHRRAAQGSANNGKYPIPCRLTVSATRWGQRLGQKKRQVSYWTQKRKKVLISQEIRTFWLRRQDSNLRPPGYELLIFFEKKLK